MLTVGHKCGILILALIRRCGGMVDTGDLKSPGSNTVPVRVRSPAPSGTIKYRGVEQLVARRAHNPEVGGPSPPSATKQEVNPNGWPLIVFPPHVSFHHIQQPITHLFKHRNSETNIQAQLTAHLFAHKKPDFVLGETRKWHRKA